MVFEITKHYNLLNTCEHCKKCSLKILKKVKSLFDFVIYNCPLPKKDKIATKSNKKPFIFKQL